MIRMIFKILKFLLTCTFILITFSFLLSIIPEPKKEPSIAWSNALREKFGAPEYESIDKNKPLDEQVAMIEIAGRTFLIPKVFIQSNLKGKNKVTGLNLVYVMPDFTSRADFKNKDEYKKAFKNRRMSHMLLEENDGEISLDRMIENRKKNGQLTKFGGIEYGLERYIDLDDPRHLNIQYDDTYIEKDKKGKVLSLISCSPDGKDFSPTCKYRFIDKGLRYGISFNKDKYLQNWRENRHKVVERIDSFEIKSTQK